LFDQPLFQSCPNKPILIVLDQSADSSLPLHTRNLLNSTTPHQTLTLNSRLSQRSHRAGIMRFFILVMIILIDVNGMKCHDANRYIYIIDKFYWC
ncbi:MAG: hypothetical protein ACKOB4_01440, partial [Acidobacteriota bacterium]